jgi:uncharacterized SAM-binding protein YcdF (DUF218 family)
LTDDTLTREQIATITAFVDIQAPPPNDLPTAHVIFGTNQTAAASTVVAERYHCGLAPLIIVTGGVNRHTGIIEAEEIVSLLTANGVPDSVIRSEDKALDTWQNVKNIGPFLGEALDAGLSITAVSKWYHRRTVHMLKTLVPEIPAMYGIGWEPVYDGNLVTRRSWAAVPGGRRRVMREWEEIPRRVAMGEFAAVKLIDGAWR